MAESQCQSFSSGITKLSAQANSEMKSHCFIPAAHWTPASPIVKTLDNINSKLYNDQRKTIGDFYIIFRGTFVELFKCAVFYDHCENCK